MSNRRETGQYPHGEKRGGKMTDKAFITCLWFDTEGEAAANYYTSIFKDGKIGRVSRYTEAGPGAAGSERSASTATARPPSCSILATTAPASRLRCSP